MLRLLEEALTFDDVLLVPGESEVVAKDVTLSTRVSREITLNIPLMSAAMDTVTESSLAIAIAQEGGIGIVHKNLSPEQQAEQVRAVKRYESGVVREPVTISSSHTVRQLIALTSAMRFSGVPVQNSKKELVGIVTNRDVRFAEDLEAPVSSIMTRRRDLVTVREGTPLEQVKQLMHRNRIEKVLVVDDAFRLTGLITAKDIFKAERYPSACGANLAFSYYTGSLKCATPAVRPPSLVAPAERHGNLLGRSQAQQCGASVVRRHGQRKRACRNRLRTKRVNTHRLVAL
jgi:IMP dehydrogenase